VPKQVFYTPKPLPPSKDDQDNDDVLEEEEDDVFPDEATREHRVTLRDRSPAPQ